MLDAVSVPDILNHRDTAQALADGLAELLRVNSVSTFLKRKYTMMKSQHLNTFLVCIIIIMFNEYIPPGHNYSEKLHQFVKRALTDSGPKIYWAHKTASRENPGYVKVGSIAYCFLTCE